MTKPVKRKKKANIGAKSNVAKQKRKERQFMDESLSQPQENDTAQPEGK